MSALHTQEFHAALVARYLNLIHKAILEGESGSASGLDLTKLNEKLKEVYNSAEQDGVSIFEIHHLIDLSHVRKQTLRTIKSKQNQVS
ncbi:MAG: hypothetical protein ACOYL6_05680 [Bacteriovoracaceae bacterium]